MTTRRDVQVAAQRMGLTPAQCMMVGDRLETDIRMGQQAGMATALASVVKAFSDKAAATAA